MKQEPILEEEEFLPITKIDKEEKKEIEGRRRGKLEKWESCARKINIIDTNYWQSSVWKYIRRYSMKISRIFCSKENEKLKCNTLIETNIQGEPKYRDEKYKEYTDIEKFWNRTTLQEIKSKEN